MRTSTLAILSVALVAVAGLSACSMAEPASAADRRFSVGSFDRIRSTGSMDVKVTTGPAVSVVARGTQADLDRLEISVRDGALLIGSKPGSWSWSREGVAVHVSVPALSGVVLTGSGGVDVNRMAAPAVELSVTGSGDLKVAAIDAPKLRASVTGSGDLAMAGRCGAGALSVTGSGDIDADALACQTLDISVAGSGNVSANASRTANVAVMGSGDVSVIGGAACTRSRRGSGEIICR